MAVTQAMNLRPMMQHKHSIFIYPSEGLSMQPVDKKNSPLTNIIDLVIQAVRSLSVSFFIEKEPHKQLRMKRKRKGER
jgi:hypothetical protein